MRRLKTLTVGPRATIREAMRAIDRGAVEIALLVDDEGRLRATITDGDIRRALLGGSTLDEPVAPHAHENFTAVGVASGRNEVLDLMRARHYAHMPILDNARRPVGLHLLREMIGAIARPNWAVIMAGGKGTRLRPVVSDRPKPMVQVAGRPILERLVLHLVGYGIKNIFIAVNHMAEQIVDYFGAGEDHGCNIEYLREERPLGTAGALSLLSERPVQPMVVMNGDLVIGVDIGSMLAYHERSGAVATVGVSDYAHRVPYGVVRVDGQKILQIEEKPTERWQVNAAVYVVSPSLLDRVPPGDAMTMPELVEQSLNNDEHVAAYHVGPDWLDVGTPAELKRARGEL